MNNIKNVILTRDVTIMLQLANITYDRLSDFDVKIETGIETKLFHVSRENLAYDKDLEAFKLRIEYQSKDLFDLNDLKITCPFKVKVYCNNFRNSLFMEIKPEEK